MALRDMEHDRPRLEEGEIAFFTGRSLAERMKRQMCGFLLPNVAKRVGPP